MINEATFSIIPGIFLRILGVLIMLPIGNSLSNFGKVIALSFAASLFFASHIETSSTLQVYSLALEFIIGCVIALPAALTIDAVRSLGELFDNQRGVSFASVYDPSSNQSNSVMAQLASNYCLILLISAGILEHVLFAVKEGFEVIPVYSLNGDSLSSTAINVIRFISQLCGGMFQAFLICAFLFVLADIASVFLSKILNQAGLNQEVFLIKTISGFMLILALMKFEFAPSLLIYAKPYIGLLAPPP